jgi:hypothetical protein
MSELTIDVCGQAYKVRVYCLAKGFWMAAGNCFDEQLRTRGSTPQKAIAAWRKAAEFTHNLGDDLVAHSHR